MCILAYWRVFAAVMTATARDYSAARRDLPSPFDETGPVPLSTTPPLNVVPQRRLTRHVPDEDVTSEEVGESSSSETGRSTIRSDRGATTGALIRLVALRWSRVIPDSGRRAWDRGPPRSVPRTDAFIRSEWR